MNDLMLRVFALPAPFNMIVIVAALGMVTGLLTTLVKQIRKYACLRRELEFKRELVDRGMTADEIEQIVKAKSPGQSDESM